MACFVLGLNGGYWDVIGVRGVVRDRLKKQESEEKQQEENVTKPKQTKKLSRSSRCSSSSKVDGEEKIILEKSQTQRAKRVSRSSVGSCSIDANEGDKIIKSEKVELQGKEGVNVERFVEVNQHSEIDSKPLPSGQVVGESSPMVSHNNPKIKLLKKHRDQEVSF